MKQETETEMLKEYAEQEYKYGFVTDIESDTLPPDGPQCATLPHARRFPSPISTQVPGRSVLTLHC